MFVNVKNVFSSIGKIQYLVLLLLSSAILFPILCQNKNYAIVSNIAYYGKSDRTNIEYLTDLLKKEKDISVAIILGDISSGDLVEQLRLLNSYVSDNDLNLKLLPGYDDYSNHTLNHFLISQEISEQLFFVEEKKDYLFGFNSIVPFNKGVGYIDIETINSFHTEFKSQQEKSIFFFSNLPLSKIINSNAILYQVKDNRIIHFYPEENKFTTRNDKIVEIGLPALGDDNKPVYHLIEQKNDSIFITRKSFENDISEIMFSEAATKLYYTQEIKTQAEKFESYYKLVSSINYNATSTTGISIADNRIYVTLDNGLIYLLDYFGKEKFVSEIFGTIKTDPVLYKDLFLVATVNGDLYSLNSNNGEVIQVVGIGENITTDLSVADLDKTTKSVVLGTVNGSILAYDAFTFELLWNKKLSTHPIVSRAVFDNDKLIFIDAGYSVYCVNAKSGVLIWKYSQKSDVSPAYNFPLTNGSNVFVLSPEGNLIALDILQGKKIWSADTKTDIKKLYMNSNKSHIYVLNSSGRFFSVSVKDGKIEFSLDVNKSNIFSYEIIERGNEIIIGFSDGSLYSISENKIVNKIIEPTFVPITSLNQLNNNLILIKDINGNLSFIKKTE